MKHLDVNSNLCYIIVGLGMWSQTPIIALSLILLGIASATYHYTKNNYWMYADWLSMYLVLSAIIGHYNPQLGFGCLLASLVVFAITDAKEFMYLTTGFLFAIAFSFNPSYQVFALFAIALVLQRIGESQYDHKEAYEIFHAAWHIFTAAGFYIMVTFK